MPEPAELLSLRGRAALVTGPTRGIGLAIARLFAAAGAKLILAGDDAEACDSLAAELGGTSLPTNVGDVDALRRLAQAAESAGPVDILVCNAGIAGRPGPMHAMDEAAREHLYSVNLLHPARLGAQIARAMAGRGKGSIVLLSSIAGLRGNAALGHYAVTKAGIAQIARNLAVEWGPRGVRANAIAPGLIETSWANAILSDRASAERRLAMTPLRRTGTPDEIASAALFLASDASSFITGQTLVADGGTLIGDGN